MSKIGHNGADGEADDGWFCVHRSIFTHAVVGIGDRPFTELEAWMWLFGFASFRERKVLNKGKFVILDPGQIMAAHGYLATKWRWSVGKVRWFLQRLEEDAMIARFCNKQRDKHNNNQIQVITICNYALYQSRELPKQQAKHQPQRQANNKPTTSQQHDDNNYTIKQYTTLDAKASRGSVYRQDQNSAQPGQSPARGRSIQLHPDSDDGVAELHRQSMEMGDQIKGRPKPTNELDGSRDIQLRDGRLTIVNGVRAELEKEFPGVDMTAVCNKAAKRLVDRSNPTYAQAMAAIREYAQYAIEELKKPKPSFGKSTSGRDLLAGLDAKYREKVEARLKGGKSDA